MNCQDVAALCPEFLSGELDAARGTAFAQHLRACPQCAVGIEQQTRMDSLLRKSILAEQLDTAPLEARVRANLLPQRPIFSFRKLSWLAGVAAMLLLAIFIYQIRTPPLCADAARDHFKEVTSHQHRKWLTDVKAIANLAERNGVSRSVVDALAPQGYRLERGKLCRLDGRLFLHLVFAQDAHEFSLYLRPSDGKPLPGAVRAESAGKLLYQVDTAQAHIASFQTGKLSALFVTDESSDAALSIARNAARVL